MGREQLIPTRDFVRLINPYLERREEQSKQGVHWNGYGKYLGGGGVALSYYLNGIRLFGRNQHLVYDLLREKQKTIKRSTAERLLRDANLLYILSNYEVSIQD